MLQTLGVVRAMFLDTMATHKFVSEPKLKNVMTVAVLFWQRSLELGSVVKPTTAGRGAR